MGFGRRDLAVTPQEARCYVTYQIGALAAFLCDDRVRHMTGATFDVNGASYLR